MKKYFCLSFGLFFACLLQAQIFVNVTVSGTITKSGDGSPVVDWTVQAFASAQDTLIPGYGTTQTDTNGNYSVQLNVPLGIGVVTVISNNGCLNGLLDIVKVSPIINAQAHADFEICADQNLNCWASIQTAAETNNSLAFNFSSEVGSLFGQAVATDYLWEFGDGTTSTDTTPNHVYAQAGVYLVTLHVTTLSGCQTTALAVVTAVDINVDLCLASINLQAADSLSYSFTGSVYSVTGDSLTALSFNWDFGDGTSSSSAAPLHTYSIAGVYVVTLTVQSASGCLAVSTLVVITDLPEVPLCGTYITYEHQSTNTCAFTAHTFQLNADSTQTLSFNWDFGDGETSSDPSPVHTYDDPGIYLVHLKVVTADSCVSHDGIVIIAQDCQVDTFWYDCQALFAANFNAVDSLKVTFNDLSLGIVTNWSWDFGDDSTSIIANPAHTYAAAGAYVVTLSVETIDGCESAVSFEINVGNNNSAPSAPSGCQALCIPLPDTIGGTGIQFIDLSVSEEAIVSWSWNFGDGTSSTDQNPYHNFSISGLFTVSLTIETADSCSSIFTFDLDTQTPWNFDNNNPALGISPDGFSGSGEIAGIGLVRVFPNPVQDQMTLAFNNTSDQDLLFRILDMNGRVVFSNKENLSSGPNLVQIPVGNLAPGLFLVEIQTKDQFIATKFVKQ